MDGFLFLLVMAIGLAVFGVAAAVWGVDSRDDSRDPTQTQVGLP